MTHIVSVLIAFVASLVVVIRHVKRKYSPMKLHNAICIIGFWEFLGLLLLLVVLGVPIYFMCEAMLNH
jgi:hypothetical protein